MIEKINWRNYDGILARFISQKEVRGFRKKDIVINPGEAVVYIRNGKVDEIMTQTRLRKVSGGFASWLARKLNVGDVVSLLFIELRPFQLDMNTEGVTADGIRFQGAVRLMLQFDVSQVAKLLDYIYRNPIYKEKGFIRKKLKLQGYETIFTKDDITDMIEADLARSLVPEILRNYNSADIKGNPEIPKRLQVEAQRRLRKTFEMLGLNMTGIQAVWDSRLYAAISNYREQMSLVTAQEGVQLEAALSRIEQQYAQQRKQLEEQLGIDELRQIHEEDMKDMRAGHEVSRWEGRRRKEIEIENLEDEKDMETLSNLVDLKAKMNEQKIRRYQQTELQAKQIEAQAEVEKARVDVETYKTAEERERDHHIKMMAEMAKIANVAQGRPVPGEGAPTGRICRHCGRAVDPDWNACPFCGKKLK